MKKLALVAALAAAFTGSAFAQSSVTLYGRINTSIERQDNDSVDKTVMRNNSSRWGLRGSEDLGGGLNAFFQLEAGFGSDDGSGSGGFSRDAFVGLKSSSLGQIKLGKFTSALYYGTIDYIGVFNHDTGTTSEDNIWALNSVVFNNGVEYTSPKFGPVEVVLTATAGEGTQNKTYEGAVNYDQGDLHVGFGYSQTRDIADDDVAKGFAIAASYVFGPLFVGLSYDNVDVAGLGKRDAVTATAMYTVGASEFHLSYGHAGEWDNVPDSDANQFTLGYNYNLSKRTKLYAFYFAVDNEDGTANAITYGGSGNLAAVPGQTWSSFGLGIRHNF